MKSIKEYVFQKAAHSRISVSGVFELTPRCNFNCKMCYIRMAPDNKSVKAKELTADEWINIGDQAVKNGLIYLMLTGGEPFLRPDFCRIYSALVSMGVMVTVNTNAMLLTEEIIECFKRYRPERVNITLYGTCDETYEKLCGAKNGFSTVKKNIERLLENGVLVTLNTTFTRLNVNEMESIVSFAKSRSIPVRMSGYIFPPVRNGNEETDVNLTPAELGIATARFDKLTLDGEVIAKKKERIFQVLAEKEPEQTEEDESLFSSCMAGKSSFWVSWDGKMFPCGMLDRYFCDVRADGFEASWKKTVSAADGIKLPKKCTGCIYKKFCPNCAAVFECSGSSAQELLPDMCERTKAYMKSFVE